MNIEYKIEIPEVNKFAKLFETTGWNDSYKLSPDELFTALNNSWYSICAYDGDELVGYGRMICDGIVHALILDMIIIPEYQGRGIGAIILNMMVEKCKEHKIRDVQLFSAKDKQGFYEKYGFTIRPEDAPGMEIKLRF